MIKRMITTTKSKVLAILFTLIICTGLVSFPVLAETAIPTTIGAPQHFGVGHYQAAYFYYTFTLPDDLRAFLDSTSTRYVISAQLDYKLEDGDWHYESAWDTAKFTLKNTLGFSYVQNEWYLSEGRQNLTYMFQEDTAALQSVQDSGWNIPPVSLSFRVRFVTSFDGNKTFIYSDWSEPYVYSKNVTKDPDELINHAPLIISAEVEKNSGGQPYLYIKTAKQPGDTLDLNSITSNGMGTEIWLRKAGDSEFKKVGESFFKNEYILIDVNRYFDKALSNYDAECYEIKIRYVLNDLRKYKQIARSDIIYSPFSNVISHNMPSWSEASAWATTELEKADNAGLIPDSLKGADMTKPITREEFAELAVRLYEKVTGKASIEASTNPFSDTVNPEILKAFQLGITTGTSATTFDPKEVTNREQVATMLSRATRVMVPEGDFSTAGAPAFSDQEDISPWALEHVKFMGKIGIIKGTDGKFMPKATTTAQQADGYATTTREQAIAMSVRIFDKYKP